MKRFLRDLFAVDVATDEEFDELVSELLQVEPPPSLVDDILSSVAKVSLTHHVAEQGGLGKDQEGLIIYHGLAQPS